MNEYHFSYAQIHKAVDNAARHIIDSGFEPDIILAVGGGGFIPARILRTYIKKPIIAITVSYYDESDKPMAEPRKHQWLEGLSIKGKNVLLVDEVDDSRTTLEYCINDLLKLGPKEIGVFVVHNKLKTKRGKFPEQIKHFFVGENLADHWIRYPWDAGDIDEHEQRAK